MAKKKLNAIESLSLTLSLAVYLGSHRNVPLENLAEHFGVSEETIESAVRTLGVSGVGSYGFSDLFDLNYDMLEGERIVDISQLQAVEEVPRLSTAEAAIFISGLNYLRSLPEFAKDKSVVELINLMNSGSGAGQTRVYDIRPGTQEYDFSRIRGAIAQQVRIRCEYINNKGEQSERELHPLRLESRDQIWYLQAYCSKSEEVRFFKVEQMRITEITDQPISDEARNSEIREEIFQKSETDVVVTVELEPEAFSLAAEFGDGSSVIYLDDGRMRVDINIGFLPYLGKLISQFGGAAVVVAPPEARAIVRDYALRSLGQSGLNETDLEED